LCFPGEKKITLKGELKQKADKALYPRFLEEIDALFAFD